MNLFTRSFFFLFLLISIKINGQNVIKVDSFFSEKELFKTASYYHDKENKKDISTINSVKFLPFNKRFPGLKNTKFWFKYKLNNSTDKQKNLFLKIKANTIASLQLYKLENTTLKKVYTYKNSLKRQLEIPILLNSKENSCYLIEVYFKRSTYFPAKIVSVNKNTSINRWVFAANLLFLGFSFIVLIINLLFFINTKNRFFLYYCFLFIAIFLSVIDTQGKLSALINNVDLKYVIIFILNVLLITSHIAFTSNALELRKFFPKHKYLGVILISALIFFYLMFFVTSNFLWYRFAKIIYFISIISFWFYGVLLFKKLIYARFYTIAYFSLLCFEIFYILSLNFGFFGIFYSEELLLLGCLMEMLVFLYAISYRHKEVEKKKDYLEFTYAESLENIKKLEEKVLLQKQEAIMKLKDKIQLFQKIHNLNARETEVLKGVLKGLKNKEIAEELFLSEASIKHYNSRLFEKTNTKNKLQLINLFNKKE